MIGATKKLSECRFCNDKQLEAVSGSDSIPLINYLILTKYDIVNLC